MDEEFLATCFPDQPVSALQNALRECRGDVDKALDWLLTSISLENLADEDEANGQGPIAEHAPADPVDKDSMLACLMSIFSDVDEVILLAILDETAYDLDKAIEQLSKAYPSGSSKPKKVQRSSSRTIIPVDIKFPSPKPADETEVLANSQKQLGSTISQRPSASATALRNKAAEVAEERNYLFHRASEAYRRGGEFRGAVASYYATQGHQKNMMAKEINMLAARQLVCEQKPTKRSDTDLEASYWVDLHGVRVQEALVIIAEELDGWYRRETTDGITNPKVPLTIITGTGKRAGREPKLLPAIHKYLTRNGWLFDTDDDSGMFVVRNKMRVK